MKKKIEETFIDILMAIMTAIVLARIVIFIIDI